MMPILAFESRQFTYLTHSTSQVTDTNQSSHLASL